MSLIEYIYVDTARLSSYFEQISNPTKYDKVPVWRASLGLSGPKAEALQQRSGRAFTRHEKVTALVDYLQEQNLISHKRSSTKHGEFFLEVCRARPVHIPAFESPTLSSPRLNLWISPPRSIGNPGHEQANEDESLLLCLLLDFPKDDDGYPESLSTYSLWARVWCDAWKDGRYTYKNVMLEAVKSKDMSWPTTAEGVLDWLVDVGAQVGTERSIRVLYRFREFCADRYSSGPEGSVFGYPEVALLSPMDSITHMLRSVETGVLGSLDLTCGEI